MGVDQVLPSLCRGISTSTGLAVECQEFANRITHTHAHTIKYANPLVLNFDTMPLVSRKRARCEVRSGRFLFCFYLEADPIN